MSCPGLITLRVPLPLIENPEIINNHLKNASNDKKPKILNDLKITRDDVILIEERTRDHSGNQYWFKLRQNRFAASMNNILHQKDPKTPRGFKTLANNLIFGDKKTDSNQVIQYKLSYGKFYLIQYKLSYGKIYEPIALQKYIHI